VTGSPRRCGCWPEAGAAPQDVDRLWHMFLRRFDIEQTFRLFKQTPGRTAPTIRTPQAADRWTAMIVAVYPNSAWPGTWPRTSAGPGNGPPRRAG